MQTCELVAARQPLPLLYLVHITYDHITDILHVAQGMTFVRHVGN